MRIPQWLRYVLIVPIALAGLFFLRLAQHPAAQMAITVAMAGSIAILGRLSSPGGLTTRRVAYLVLVATGAILLGYCLPRLTSPLETDPQLNERVSLVLSAGGGWLLPILLLAAFAVAVMLRLRRLHH